MATLTSWEYFEDLRKGGATEELALSQAKALDKALGNLTTKDDMKRLDDDIKEVRGDIKKCLYGIIIGVIVLVLKTAFHW